jgi:hypothetical protein
MTPYALAPAFEYNSSFPIRRTLGDQSISWLYASIRQFNHLRICSVWEFFENGVCKPCAINQAPNWPNANQTLKWPYFSMGIQSQRCYSCQELSTDSVTNDPLQMHLQFLCKNKNNVLEHYTPISLSGNYSHPIPVAANETESAEDQGFLSNIGNWFKGILGNQKSLMIFIIIVVAVVLCIVVVCCVCCCRRKGKAAR